MTEGPTSALPMARPGNLIDLVACCGLVIVAVLAFAMMPAGSVLRLALALPFLLFVPGYLLIEAVAGPARPRSSRAVRCALALGVSPPLVGLLALATALVPGGFTAAPIVAILTVSCLGLAGAALWRRRTHGSQSVPNPAAT